MMANAFGRRSRRELSAANGARVVAAFSGQMVLPGVGGGEEGEGRSTSSYWMRHD